MRRRIFRKQIRSKISRIIEYLYEYLRDIENVDSEYFTLINSSHWTLKYDVKTAQGKCYIEVTDFYIYYYNETENIFKVYSDRELESQIPLKDVSSFLEELVDLTKRKPPKYNSYMLEDKWLKWWK